MGGKKRILDQILRNQFWSWYYSGALNNFFFLFFFPPQAHFSPFHPPPPIQITQDLLKRWTGKVFLLFEDRESFTFIERERGSLSDCNSPLSCAGSSERGVIHWGKGHNIKTVCNVQIYIMWWLASWDTYYPATSCLFCSRALHWDLPNQWGEWLTPASHSMQKLSLLWFTGSP